MSQSETPLSIRSHEIPSWLQDALKKDSPQSEIDELAHYFLTTYGKGGWLDHWGVVKERNTELLISEPYSLERGAVLALVKFCDTLKLDFDIQGKSTHFPGETLRIVIRPLLTS